MKEKCSNCKFGKDINCGYLLCRRYPPSTGPNHDQYPEVLEHKWCGEWKQIAVNSNHELEGKPHQKACTFHIEEELSCYCSVEGKDHDRIGLPCYACYHGLMTKEEVERMDD